MLSCGVRADESFFLDAPDDVEAVWIAPTILHISWTAPTGHVAIYEVKYRDIEATRFPWNTIYVEPTETEIDISNLQADAIYMVQVFAVAAGCITMSYMSDIAYSDQRGNPL